MSTVGPTPSLTGPAGAPHQARAVAESFGTDAARYDRTRPRYPNELVVQIRKLLPAHPDSPGDPAKLVDVGIGTGISALPYREAGCSVVGVEVDERMAAFARDRGFEVEIGESEHWRHDWLHTYSESQWLEQVPSFGGHNLLTPDQLTALLAGLRTAIREHGSGQVEVHYTTLAILARAARG